MKDFRIFQLIKEQNDLKPQQKQVGVTCSKPLVSLFFVLFDMAKQPCTNQNIDSKKMQAKKQNMLFAVVERSHFKEKIARSELFLGRTCTW